MFTDLHCHIIYGVDDGAQTLQDAKAMLIRAVEQNVRRIICTSHAMPGREIFPLETYRRHLQEEQDWCRQEGLDLQLYEGCEILWDESAPRLLKEGAFPSLCGGRYALVEFFPTTPWEEIKHAALALSIAGYYPVVAHVERYACLRKAHRIQELSYEYGAVLQMNTHTVLTSAKVGLFGDRWPAKVLAEGLIDIVASDAHDVKERPCRLGEAYKFLIERYSRGYAEQVCMSIPGRICNGEPV